MRATQIFKEFLQNDRASGIILIACTVLSILMANSIWGDSYLHFWHYKIIGQPLEYWINDGLMAIFFLMVGLELEREIYIGELSNLKNALLPIFAAVGGMLLPAGIHLFFNYGTATQAGAGIPMATDIAFSLGVLSLLGTRIPVSLKIFLTALAIADDLGAILIIAFFYTGELHWINLCISLSIWVFLFVLGKRKVYILWPYVIGGLVMWYFMLHSGVHATITGVMLAFAIPFGKDGKHSLSADLQHNLHVPVLFIILPLFALANTCIVLADQWYLQLMQPNTIGIYLGLVLGKPVGIMLFVILSLVLGITTKPKDVSWTDLAGAGILAGIGFTMSIFVALLAFTDTEVIKYSQVSILLASLTSGLLGYLWFVLLSPKKLSSHPHKTHSKL